MQNENNTIDTEPVKIKLTYYALNTEEDVKDIQLITSPLKMRDISVQQRHVSAHPSATTYSEISFESSSECGDSVQSFELEQHLSKSSRKLSGGDINHKSEQDTKPSESDIENMLVKSQPMQSVSTKSLTVVSDNTKQPSAVVDTCAPSSETLKIFPHTIEKAIIQEKNTAGPCQDSLPTETTSGSVLDSCNTCEEHLSTALSLQTNIGSASLSLSKRTDTTMKSMGQGRKTSQSPELILETVVFETDYDIHKKKKTRKIYSVKPVDHIKETDKTVKTLPLQKQSRPYLTDPEEHVILSDDEDQAAFSTLHKIQQDLLQKYEKTMQLQNDAEIADAIKGFDDFQNTGKSMGCSPHFAEVATNDQNKIKPELDLARSISKSPSVRNRDMPSQPKDTFSFKNSVYLKLIENKTNAKRHDQSQAETSQTDTCSDDKSILTNQKVLRKSNCPGKFKRKSGKPGHNHKPFNDMISNYSVKIMKQRKKFDSIKKGIPVIEKKDQILQMMENFLEEKYFPKLNIPQGRPLKPIRLAPLVNAPKPSVASLLRQVHLEPFEDYKIQDFFPQRIPGNFAEMLATACQDFLVRKEQVTLSNSWQTLTSITINRKLPKIVV